MRKEINMDYAFSKMAMRALRGTSIVGNVARNGPIVTNVGMT